MGDAGSGGDATAVGGSPLECLLALQDADVHGEQLAHRRGHLPEQAALDAILRAMATLDEQSSEPRERRAELAAREAELERETGDVVARVAVIESRARSGAASSYRDQEAMATEIAALGKHREDLEAQELEVLEAAEPLDAELAEADGRRRELELELASARAALDAAAASLDEEVVREQARRAELAAQVPASLLAQYEPLRARLGGVGVARLVRGVCAGCHLALPATEVDRLRHLPEGAVAHCEQCGRMLVP
ncbi:MAG: C4-type zinc ribbon domain-containing protein [Actinomycetota bacterium]|nr:C4-type zinc ribbon domain-containing protein [Actinomycetota bacterium]